MELVVMSGKKVAKGSDGRQRHGSDE